MSKITYIIKASEDSLNEKTAAILTQVVKQNFITSAEIRENLAETINASSVNSNIGVLIKKGFIEKSADGLMVTEDGMDIINKAADIYAAEEKPELTKVRKTRSARGVTSEMTKMADEVKVAMEAAEFEVKEIAENRSNLEVRLVKRTKGIRQIEVRRDGKVRIFGYNMDEALVKAFSDAGFATKIGGKNVYIDTTSTASLVEVQTMLKVLA
ncbi:MotA-like activator of middle period transcription [Escherichia phage EcS1]|uniref:Transcriptional regulator of middle promoters n=1 Tax=Escherichia phage EcS1 TaxID=2083276 RepID=A0A2Z5ZCE6_9CAUD|nr:MotA-like activator of middle period transcription [Escherichia phage EcS1]BBC78330.1 Transcriptional regulator of middle promoters [Escherichia phage EcS1]